MSEEFILKKLAKQFPGIFYPTEHPVSAAGLIGFLNQELTKSETLMEIAKANLPTKQEKNCPACGKKEEE